MYLYCHKSGGGRCIFEELKKRKNYSYKTSKGFANYEIKFLECEFRISFKWIKSRSCFEFNYKAKKNNWIHNHKLDYEGIFEEDKNMFLILCNRKN